MNYFALMDFFTWRSMWVRFFCMLDCTDTYYDAKHIKYYFSAEKLNKISITLIK